MSKTKQLLRIVSSINKVELCEIANGKAENILTGEKLSMDDGTIRKRIDKVIADVSHPVLIQDENRVFFACLKDDKSFYLLGPVSVRPLSGSELRKHYRLHHIDPHVGHDPKVMPISEFLELISLISGIIGGNCYEKEDLLKLNDYPASILDDNKHEQAIFQLSSEEEADFHHTYKDEQALLCCVREGRTNDALMYNMKLDTNLGQISKKEFTHWFKLVTISITLCTRAAIEGGLSPISAYSISDFYLQKIDACRSIPSLLSCRNQAIAELTDKVNNRLNNRRTSSYVEKCKDYVSKYYMKKIRIKDIASALGINESYLSRIFSKEAGTTFQDYVNIIRSEKAANLLIYSEETLTHISEYVGFPSQSYFGKIFLRFKGMTPRQYREKHKPAEFNSTK